MRLRTAVLALLCVAALLFGWTAVVQAQSQKAYTFFWYHDGVGTDSYNVVVDGGTPINVPSNSTVCVGTGATRLCTMPTTITLTTNVSRTVTVSAVNIFGVNDSDPFPAGPPKGKPTGVGAK